METCRDRALAAAALPPVAQEAADRGRPAGAPAPGARGGCASRSGCGTGLTSHFLRERGGTWVSATSSATTSARPGSSWATGCSRSATGRCRSGAASFDLVAAINFLEHIEDDETFFAEMVRVLKPGGDFLFMAPKGDHGRPGFALKRALGFTADQEGFGHARDGYPLAGGAGRSWSATASGCRGRTSYCRFFTESLEDLLNYAYHRKAMQGKDTEGAGFPRGHRADVGRRAQQGRAPRTRCTPPSIPRCARGPCSTG